MTYPCSDTCSRLAENFSCVFCVLQDCYLNSEMRCAKVHTEVTCVETKCRREYPDLKSVFVLTEFICTIPSHTSGKGEMLFVVSFVVKVLLARSRFGDVVRRIIVNWMLHK